MQTLSRLNHIHPLTSQDDARAGLRQFRESLAKLRDEMNRTTGG